MKKSVLSVCLGLAVYTATVPASVFAIPVAEECRADIESRLKEDFRESFFQNVMVGRKKKTLPLREIMDISCILSRTSGPVGGPKLFDCDVSTTAALDANGDEVGAGDMTFSVKVQARTCAVLLAELTGEE